MESYYNIHNLVTVGIATKRPQIVKEYEYYIRDFKTQGNLAEADLQIKDLEDFLMPQDATEIEKGFFSFKNGIFNKKKSYAIIVENNRIFLFTKDASISLHVLLEHLLLKKGCTFIHAAAVSHNNRGIIFPANPNTGKTMLISKLRNQKNITFFGDDFVIIGNGKLYSFPSDFSIYNYHFDFFPELKKTSANVKIKKAFFERLLVNIVRNLPIKKAIKKFAHIIGYEYLMGGEYLKVPAKDLILPEKIGSEESLQYILLLEKYYGNEITFQPEIPPEAMARRMTEILEFEWKDTIPVLKLLSIVGILNETKFFGDIQSRFTQELRPLTLVQVFLPNKMKNEERTEKLTKFLEKEIFAKP